MKNSNVEETEKSHPFQDVVDKICSDVHDTAVLKENMKEALLKARHEAFDESLKALDGITRRMKKMIGFHPKHIDGMDQAWGIVSEVQNGKHVRDY
jgi:hypothetical protein